MLQSSYDHTWMNANCFTVSIKKEDNVTFAGDVFIYHGGDACGYSVDVISLQCLSGDEDAYIGSCSRESSTPWIAQINSAYGNECEMLLISEGTATITVTTDSRLVDSFEVTCVSIGEIKTEFAEITVFGDVNGDGELNSFNGNENNETIYMAFGNSNNKKSAETDVPTVVGSVFATGAIALSGVAGIGIGMCLMGLIKGKKKTDKE